MNFSTLPRVCDEWAANRRWARVIATLVCGLIAGTCSAQAQTTDLTPEGNNLYNTGYHGDVLATANQTDTHYVLTNYLSPLTYQSTPVQPAWTPNATIPGAQWISVVPAHVPTNTPPIAYANATFDYQLTLTNIPRGVLVTLTGHIAADDNATISVNGATPFFSNYKSVVAPGNYAHPNLIPSLTFVSGATNDLIIAVSNLGGGPTGLILSLTGSYTVITSTVGLGIQIAPPPPGLTPNQQSILKQINRINAVGVDNACFAELTVALLNTNTPDFGAALDQLSAEKLGIFSSIAFNDASFRTQNLDDYAAHRRNAVGEFQVYPDKIDTSGLTFTDPTMDSQLAQISSRLLAWSPPRASAGLVSDSTDPRLTLVPPAQKDDLANDWNFFVSGDVILGQNLSEPEIEHTDYTTSSFQAGADIQLGKHWMVGALFDYAHTDTGLDEQGSTATVDSYSPGMFASFSQDGWFANAIGTYSRNQYTEQRVINIGSYHRVANGAPQGDEEMGDLDGGYEFHTKHWTYGPTLGLQYVHLNVNSFDESGGCSTDLSVGNEGNDSLRSRFGGRISYEMFDHDNKVIFTPYIDASWQHEFLAGSQVIQSSFNELGFGSFAVSTPQTTRDSALLVAGLNADITDDMTLFSNYAVQVGQDNYFGQSIVAGLKIGF